MNATTSNPPNDVWNDNLLRNPHTVADKRSRVQRMFAAIAPSYDLNNRLHSFFQDQRWRRRAVHLSDLKPDDVVVDVACGTGDLAMQFHRHLVELGASRPQVIGVDFTFEMLPLARHKSCFRSHPAEMGGKPLYLNGDAQALPLPDACCDVVSIAFGIRNVQEPRVALAEFFRILRPGGRVIILEFSEPENRLLRALNRFYCGKIMPRTATWISRDRSGAYKYLPESIKTFIGRPEMMRMMRDAGFEQVAQHPMTFGVCVCYRGVKPIQTQSCLT